MILWKTIKQTSEDHNPKSDKAYDFFKIVQNKLQFAIFSHTAVELIYSRLNSTKNNIGLNSWKNSPNGLIYIWCCSCKKLFKWKRIKGIWN